MSLSNTLGIIPNGVTKRSLATALSRGNPFHISGSVEVVCGHGRIKRSVQNLVADIRFERVEECDCCLNLYAAPEAAPGLLCQSCRPQGLENG